MLSKRQSTIQHWASTGQIPAKWQQVLLQLARERGIDVAPSDFMASSGHSHAVQFYENDAFLIDRVAQFVASAIETGQAAVIVATKAHRRSLARALLNRGIDIAAGEHRRLYLSLDAGQVLAKFMVNGYPDRERCLATLQKIINQANSASRAARPCAAVFGEMVALLWKRGNRASAIELERLWNELQKDHDFSLLCGYPLTDFSRTHHSGPFHEICAQHSDVVPAESYSSSSEPERQRAVVRLQQRMQALEAESRLHKQRIDYLEKVTSAATWELDLLEDRLRLSSTTQELLGCTGREHIALSDLLQRIQSSDDREALLAAIKRARTGPKELDVTFRVRHNGSGRQIAARGKTFFNSGQPLILGVMSEKNTTDPSKGRRYGKISVS
jgi:PAS domain-containing protein